MILVIGEQRGGKLNRTTWEAVAAAQQLGGDIRIAIAGADLGGVAGELASAAADRVAEVVVVDHPALEKYTPDGYTAASQAAIEAVSPDVVLLAHTYQTRDFAPKLAARLSRPLITDVTAIKQSDGKTLFIRPMFQGKLAAEVEPLGAGPHFATLQVGAYRADHVKTGASAASVRRIELPIDAAGVRQKPEAPFQQSRQAVDLTQAERIVAVGRGIKGQEHLPIAQKLAMALGAEIAASRPICD